MCPPVYQVGKIYGCFPRKIHYRFNVGSAVQLVQNGRAYAVEWRGVLYLRDGQLWRGQPAYWLSGEQWNCYFEDELHSV